MNRTVGRIIANDIIAVARLINVMRRVIDGIIALAAVDRHIRADIVN